MKMFSRFLVTALALSFASVGFAQESFELMTVNPGENGSQSYSTSIQVLIVMTMLTLLPALLMTMTSFTRIIVVLAILRQALGTVQTPSNQILLGLALFTSLFIMKPIFEQAYESGIAPYLAEEVTIGEGLEKAFVPMREFMLAQTRETDLMMFADLAGSGSFATLDEVPLSVLLPSFLTSELKTAFQIGFLIFIPFLIIDLVVASVLMSMGMMMLSPMIISLPFKIMLFVLIDGWSLVLGTLVGSFYG